MIAWNNTFKEAFCRYFACSPEAYDKKALFHFLYPHAVPVAFLLYPFKGTLVKGAVSLVQTAGQARNIEELLHAINDYYSWLELHSGFWARTFKLRISGGRMLRILPLLFENGSAQPSRVSELPSRAPVPN
jgi:hypothetical protein